jgi:hypothetical protein
MIKKAIFFIVLFFAFYANTYTQNGYFNNTYNLNNKSCAGSNIIYNSEDSTFSTTTATTDSVDKLCILFSKFDYNGNLLMKKYFNDGVNFYYSGHPGNFQKVWDGGYTISSAKEDTNGFAIAILLKFDKNFNFEFIKEFEDTSFNHYAEFQQCKITKDKNFILAGTIQGFGNYDHDILLIKTDSLGNQLFRKTYNLGAIDNARSIIETPDKGYLLGGYSWDYYNAWASGNGRIIKLDSMGNFEWGRQFGNPIYNDAQALVALAPDSNYIVATSYAYYTMPLSASDLKIQVIKIDKTDGSTIWDRQYDTIRVDNYPKMVKVLTDGNIVVVGNEDFWDGFNYYSTSYILKLKPNGDSILFRRFFKNNNQYTLSNTSWDFCIAEDKSIVSCGYVSMQNDYQKLWLVKMDSLGCLQPGCDPTAGIEEPHYLKPGQLQIYPNPATTQATISYPTTDNALILQIYNMLGQLVYEEKLSKGSSQTTLDTRAYKKGLYKVVVGESNGTLVVTD